MCIIYYIIIMIIKRNYNNNIDGILLGKSWLINLQCAVIMANIIQLIIKVYYIYIYILKLTCTLGLFTQTLLSCNAYIHLCVCIGECVLLLNCVWPCMLFCVCSAYNNDIIILMYQFVHHSSSTDYYFMLGRSSGTEWLVAASSEGCGRKGRAAWDPLAAGGSDGEGLKVASNHVNDYL